MLYQAKFSKSGRTFHLVKNVVKECFQGGERNAKNKHPQVSVYMSSIDK